MNNNNPLIQIKKFIKQQGGNPRQLLINYMQQNNSNPILNNLIEKAKNGDTKAVETFARNLYNQKGGNLDKDLQEIKKYFNS